MSRVLFVLLAGSLLLSAGHAFAQGSRQTAQQAQTRQTARTQAVDPNSEYARAQAAIVQGFAPINTSLGRGSNR